MTECSQSSFDLQAHFSREVVARFDGGAMTSDAGAVLLRETDRRLNLLPRVAACFVDHRKPWLVLHPVQEMVAQRVYALALGYEDLSDHDQLREDPLLAVLSGKARVGEDPLAGKSTLNRLELGDEKPSRYKKIHYRHGFARNPRLRRTIEPQMQQAAQIHQETGKPARVFTEFSYETTTGSWSRPRRVVAKAEQLDGKENPRFVVTNLSAEDWPAQGLYEELYCARGEMENRIKEQLPLFAYRVSAETMSANQLRLYLAAMAYVLMHGLRRLGPKGTELERAQATTIRLRLLKIGAQIRITVRKVWLSMSSGFPLQRLFGQAYQNLRPAIELGG